MRSPTLALLLVSTTGCIVVPGSGVPATQAYPLDAFRTLEARNLISVDITVGTEPSAEVTCDDNLFDYFDISVAADTLTVRTVPSGTALQTRLDCVMNLVVVDLEAVRVSGSGDVTSQASFDQLSLLTTSGSGDLDFAVAGGDRVEVRASGSGDVQVDDLRAGTSLDAQSTGSGSLFLEGITADAVMLGLSGSGRASLVGHTTDLDLRISGSGGADASGMPTVDASVRLSGSGSADVRASGRVTGSLTGSGGLVVRGGADVDVRTTGSGSVSQR